MRQYKLRAAAPFPQGIDPPCVAVVDLDEVPRRVVENGYSTPADLHGLMCLLMLFETLITFTIHVFYFFDWGWFTWLNWIRCVQFNMIFCFFAVFLGDGTLTLARRLDTSAPIPFPGCAVLLDQDFTVVLNGSQNVVEAIAKSSFNLSHPNSVWRLGLGGDDHVRDSSVSYNLLEGLCEAACFIIFASCWLLFRPTTPVERMAPMVIVAAIGFLSQRSPPDHFTPLQVGPFIVGGFLSRILPPLIFLMIYEQGRVENSYFAFGWQRESHFLSLVLFALFLTGYRTRNYPIRSAKFFDVLGHPPVRKWQFDTLAAAATFQCLVLCRGITRPIRSIEVLALLDLLVPDQRDIWKAWKERVADRIVHETEILYAPTIPTFGDERQQQLKDLLDQAQLGDDAYRRFYVWRSAV